MIQHKSFTFNPFQENTYVLWDESNDCIIIDPGCYDRNEEKELADFIEESKLNPVKVVNTHCHIDHIFGNTFCTEKYKVPLLYHIEEVPIIEAAMSSVALYGLQYNPSPEADYFLVEGEKLFWGDSSLSIRFTPGHSPGSVCFIADKEQFVIGGDVLFNGSIGRTDLPGGDHQTLLNSIRRELFTLPDEFIVYSGHGPSTQIDFERRTNPHL
jgi:hydroxyacylglutathione hydrolase